jgi:DNA invertase Pin-like site-specific DNA recombinase
MDVRSQRSVRNRLAELGRYPARKRRLDLNRRGIGFRSLTESFDTKTALGRGVLALLAAVAEDERDRLRERTRGRDASRSAGRETRRQALHPDA